MEPWNSQRWSSNRARTDQQFMVGMALSNKNLKMSECPTISRWLSKHLDPLPPQKNLLIAAHDPRRLREKRAVIRTPIIFISFFESLFEITIRFLMKKRSLNIELFFDVLFFRKNMRILVFADMDFTNKEKIKLETE